MTDEEREILTAAIACNNRMVRYFHEFLRERKTGEKASVDGHDVLAMYDEVEAHRIKASLVQNQFFDRMLWPADDVATYLGSTWRLLTGVAIGGKVRLVPYALELREPKPYTFGEAV